MNNKLKIPIGYNKEGSLVFFNADDSIRWDILILKNPISKEYEIWENTESSLFSNPLASGYRSNVAITNFLMIEQKLLDSL